MVNFSRNFQWLCMTAAWLAAFSVPSLPTRSQDPPRTQEPNQVQNPDDEKPPEPRQADTPNFPDVLKEGTLDLTARLYLPDGRNKPIFYPNMRIADVLDMKRDQALRAEGGDLPNYVFDELTIEARIGATAADIKARAKITLSETAVRSTAIALRMQSCLLSEPIIFEGGGLSKCQVGRNDQPGYTWWLRADPNTSHTATLIGQSVLLSEGDRQSLQLTLPLALATVDVYLPPNCQDVRVRGQGGELLRDDSSNGEHKVVVRCQGGDINISWRSGSDGNPAAGAAEAETKTSLRIEDPREPWLGDTTIKLSAHGGAPVDSLLVDLPEGAEWLPPISPTEQYTISVVTPTGAATGNSTNVVAPDNASASGAAAPSPVTANAQTGNAQTGNAQTGNAQTLGGATATIAAGDAASPPAPRTRVQLLIRAVARTGLATLEPIPIGWRWTPPGSTAETALNDIAVPSISVREVDRHEGETRLVVPTAYGLYWKSQQGTHLLAQASIGQRTEYVFQFTRQPQGLLISFRRELNVPEVRPIYLAEVERGKVKLTGWLKCDFDRSHRPELGLRMGEWALHSAEAISDMSVPHVSGGELLTQQTLSADIVKLRREPDMELGNNARSQQQYWRIVAYRHISEGSIEHLKLTVPEIVLLAHDSSPVPVEHATGVLLLGASNNVLISWDERGSQSLLADALSSEWSSLLRDQTLADRTTAYRFQAGANSTPVWAGRVEVLPRQIAVEHSANIKVDIDAARIVQKFTLQIANEPLPRLQLITGGARELAVLVKGVPCVLEADTPSGELNSSASPNEAINSTPVASTPPTNAALPNSNAQQPASDSTRMTIIGAPELFGKVEVEVHSQVPIPTAAVDKAESIVKAPLIRLDLPKAVLRSPTHVSISVDRRLSASIGNGVLEGGSASSTADSDKDWSPLPSTPLELSPIENELTLRIRKLDEVDPLPVRVSGAWMQTAVNGTARADRFCARFRTQQDSITISLPSYDLLAHVAIDGVQQSGVPDSVQGRLQISLRDVPPAEEHTLEVWTRSASSLRWLNKIEVMPVKIEGCRRLDHFYWQLVTPANQHLVWIPESVTAEWRWVWDRLWWQRFSPLDQSYFEQWLAATGQLPLPESANRYVVSSYGAVPGFEVWTASRLLLWLPMGLAAIGCALAVSLWRGVRHPALLILLAGGIAAVAAAWPDLAILLGQTALMALAIVLLYSLTQAAIESRVRRRSVFTTRPTSGMLEISDQHSLVRTGSHASSEIVATTRTQSPIVTDGGGL